MSSVEQVRKVLDRHYGYLHYRNQDVATEIHALYASGGGDVDGDVVSKLTSAIGSWQTENNTQASDKKLAAAILRAIDARVGAKGEVAQRNAEQALRKGITPTPFPANWNTHGTSAGPIRNSEMVNWAVAQRDNQRNVVFIAFPGGSGTADCLRKAKRAGLMIREWVRLTNGEIVERGTPPRKREPTR